MKIINQGNEWKREIHCNYKEHDFECNCDFEVEPCDLIRNSSKTKPLNDKDYIEFMGSYYTLYVYCPNCGNKIKITNLPHQLFLKRMFDDAY